MKEVVIKLNPNVAYKIIDKQAFLIFSDSNQGVSDKLFILNETGARILKLINNKRTMQAIKKIMIREFNVEQGEAEGEIEHFIKKLSHKKVLAIK